MLKQECFCKPTIVFPLAWGRAGNPKLSPYLVEPWGGACVPMRTVPSNSNTRLGENIGGPRNLNPTLGDRGDLACAHWAGGHYRRDGMLQGRVHIWLPPDSEVLSHGN